MNRAFIIFTLILFIATGTATWFTIKIVKKNSLAHYNKIENPDGFAINAKYRQMNSDGSLHSVMHCPKLLHYSSHDSSIFQKPDITIENGIKKPWHVTAAQGSSSYGADLIKLQGKVALHQDQGKNNQELKVTTSSATVDLNHKTATTAAPITIWQPGIIATAVGADANLKQKIVHLHHKVREIDHRAKPNAYINADAASYNRLNHLSTYLGHIYFRQGTTKLYAQKLVAHDRPKDNKVYQILAYGHQANYSTLPQHKKYPIKAKANMIKYLPIKGLAFLIGQGEITEHEDKFSGPYIVYNTKTQTIISTPQNKNSLTTIILHQ